MLPKIIPDDLLEPAYQHYLAALRKTSFSGDIQSDYATRLSVATDNSIYQVIPQAVIFPRNTDDIVSALALPEFDEVKFVARGGGTATNGQSLSAGIVIDCSRYMREILEINLDEQWVRVQPGVVLDQLNQYLSEFGVHFAPEISPGNRATIGGMINTDACGNGSKVLGRTSDHVVDLTCVLHDGRVLSGDLFQTELTTLLAEHQTLIQEKFFAAPRTLSGYNLKKSYLNNKLNLNYLLCGSEGTLGVISEAKLKLSPLPKYKKLLLVKYRHFDDALRVREITTTIRPSVIEAIDEKLITLARQDSIYFYIKDFLTDANAVNLVEFAGDSEQEINQQIKQLCSNIEDSAFATGYYLAKNAAEIKLLWNLRKKSVGLISKKLDGTRRPIPFIEDTAVPPEHLADYIAEFRQLLDKHQLIYGMYGHVDAGCIHVRPALDTCLTEDEKLIRILSDQVVSLVKKYGGVIWGEHGKGYRSEYGREFFGDTLYQVLRQIKTLFDPHNRLNPGKIVTPLDSNDSLVKLDSNFRSDFDKTISPKNAEKYSFAIACNGNGACFNYAMQDPMCPSYKVTKDRVHSPKGRATVIREWLRQLAKKNYVLDGKTKVWSFIHKILANTDKKSDFSTEVYSALAGCLGCKACANQCPINVDVPDFKAKFLAQYHRRYLRSIRDYFIANTENIAHWQSVWPRFINWIIQNPLTAWLVKTWVKMVDLPAASLTERVITKSLPKNFEENALILLQDAFTAFYDTPVLNAAYEFFTALGFTVYIAPFFPNGKPLHVKGFLSRFKKIVAKNISYLEKLSGLNIPLIGIDPSITLTYRDEYKKFSDKPLTFQVLLPQEFLQQHLSRLPKISSAENFSLYSHCTEKTAIVESEKQWQTIFTAMNLKLTPIATGCCGMSGSYGHELEHLQNSKMLFTLGNWAQHAAANSLVTGYSCRSQIKRCSGAQAQHPLELLNHLIKKEIV